MPEKVREADRENLETRIRIGNMINEGGFGLGLLDSYFHNEETMLLMEEKMRQRKEKEKLLQ